MKKMAMCEYCRGERKYSVATRIMAEELDGIKFKYVEEYAVCETCKNEIYIGEIHDKNLFNYNEAYKKAAGIITIDEINNIITKYEIGKKPLSILLGWGENTIMRYLNGDFPNKKYSNVLKNILSNPSYMANILEENKSNITDVAYRKCRNKINEYIGENSVSIDVLAKYIVSKHDITPKALQKILYTIQGFSMAFNLEMIFNDIPQAWCHGPVYPEIYNRYSNFKYNVIEQENKILDLDISENHKSLIDCILKFYTPYSGDTLEKITHNEMPWVEARNGLREDEPSQNPIDLDVIYDYFTKVKNKYNMINYYDIKQYLGDMINKICN